MRGVRRGTHRSHRQTGAERCGRDSGRSRQGRWRFWKLPDLGETALSGGTLHAGPLGPRVSPRLQSRSALPDGLDFPQVATVLQNTNEGGNRLQIVAFDSCNVSLLEGAYQLREVADYLVASQFTDPLPGWPYDVILKRVAGDKDHFTGAKGPKDFGRAIVSQFVRSYEGQKNVTMTMLELSRWKKSDNASATLQSSWR